MQQHKPEPTTWNTDGQLRHTTITTNGLPDEHTPALPDETYLNTNNGDIMIIRVSDGWEVRDTTNATRGLYDSYEEAFKNALLLVRLEVEHE